MNYPNGFPCPAEIQTDFLDHNTPSTWSPPPNMPTAWGHAGLLSSPVSAVTPGAAPSFFWCFFNPGLPSLRSQVQISQSPARCLQIAEAGLAAL